jgi:osmoprotectant transport system permease protein
VGEASVVSVLDPAATARWLTDGANWSGGASIPTRVAESLQVAGLAMGISLALALPTAVVLAHLRRGEVAASAVVNLGRAVPSVAVIGLVYPLSLRNGFGFDPLPILVALVLIGLPPIFANAYTAVRGVDPGIVDAARAMGHTEGSVLARVELPLAAPVILNGVKVAAVQVVATEPLRAFFGGPGLGTFIQLGYANRAAGDPQLLGGTVLVALLAAAVAGAFGVAERMLVPRRVRRFPGGPARPEPAADPAAAPAS